MDADVAEAVARDLQFDSDEMLVLTVMQQLMLGRDLIAERSAQREGRKRQFRDAFAEAAGVDHWSRGANLPPWGRGRSPAAMSDGVAWQLLCGRAGRRGCDDGCGCAHDRCCDRWNAGLSERRRHRPVWRRWAGIDRCRWFRGGGRYGVGDWYRCRLRGRHCRSRVASDPVECGEGGRRGDHARRGDPAGDPGRRGRRREGATGRRGPPGPGWRR